MPHRGVVLAVCLLLGLVFGADGSGQSSKQEIDWVALLPEGDGKNSVLTHCMGCHGLDRIVVQQRDQGAWLGTVGMMTGEYSAMLPEEEIAPITEYLARVAGEDNPLTEVPMDVNTVAENGLRRLPFLSEEAVKRIVESRAQGKFKSLEDVQALLKLQPEQAALVPVYLKVRPPAE